MLLLGQVHQPAFFMDTPLRQLIKKANAFVPMIHHNVAFQTIIDEICRHTILKYYRPDIELVLECDASKVVMGLTHMQDFSQEPRTFGIEFTDLRHLELLAFASKTLTSTKQHYTNIKREMLAVIFDHKKFKYYTLGHHILVLGDHKPLSSITNRDTGATHPIFSVCF